MRVTMIAGCAIHYELGLVNGLSRNNISVDFITGSTSMQYETEKNVYKVNLRGDQDHSAGILKKITRLFKYYFKLILFVISSKNSLVHIQWLSKFCFLEGIVFNLIYKLFAKKVVYTAHNILPHNKDSLYLRIVFKIVYKIVNGIIVHTEKMKKELLTEFKVNPNKIKVIPHGINDVIVRTDSIDINKSRDKLSIREGDKVLLFFGGISRYKGLEYLLHSIKILISEGFDIKLLVAGELVDAAYREEIEKILHDDILQGKVIYRFERIPDEEIHDYVYSSDAIVLPYTKIYQSGVIFLAYSLGCPVLVSDVGSFSEDIVHNKTGILFKPEDSNDLALAIRRFYKEMFPVKENLRSDIIDYAYRKYSWDQIGLKTKELYEYLMRK